MNFYDKRTKDTLIHSRISKLRITTDCTSCNQEICIGNKCNHHNLELHLDTGYIIYLTSYELDYILSKLIDYSSSLDPKEMESRRQRPAKQEDPSIEDLEK